MAKGLPFGVIPELEESEFNDWLAASQALDIDRKIVMMNAASTPHMKQNDRSSLYNRLQVERDMLLGDNPFEVSEEAINATHERLKATGRVRRVKQDGNDKKRNTRKT